MVYLFLLINILYYNHCFYSLIKNVFLVLAFLRICLGLFSSLCLKDLCNFLVNVTNYIV